MFKISRAVVPLPRATARGRYRKIPNGMFRPRLGQDRHILVTLHGSVMVNSLHPAMTQARMHHRHGDFDPPRPGDGLRGADAMASLIRIQAQRGNAGWIRFQHAIPADAFNWPPRVSVAREDEHKKFRNWMSQVEQAP